MNERFLINGKAMLPPDENMQVSFEDLDDVSAGRDESGVMHRIPVRYKVGTWRFTYSQLTEAEKAYMESLFPDAPDFAFTHPDRNDSAKSVTTRAYRSQFGLAWKNASTGLWSNYSFNIIEC